MWGDTVGTTLRLVDGASEIQLRPSQPLASDSVFCASYDLGWPAPREVVQERTGQSGDIDDTYLHGGRVFQCDLKLVNTPYVTRFEVLDFLKSFLGANKRPYLYVRLDGWSAERRALCRPDSASCVVNQSASARVEVSLQLKIPGGEYESSAEYEYVLRPPSGTGGKVYPITFPMTYGSGGGSGATEIPVYGSAPTPPTYIIYGMQTNPVITDVDTGLLLSFTALGGLTIPLGSYVTVDVQNGAAYLNSDPTNSVYQYIDFSISSWWLLRPGETNRLAASARLRDDSAQVIVHFRDRYL